MAPSPQPTPPQWSPLQSQCRLRGRGSRNWLLPTFLMHALAPASPRRGRFAPPLPLSSDADQPEVPRALPRGSGPRRVDHHPRSSDGENLLADHVPRSLGPRPEPAGRVRCSPAAGDLPRPSASPRSHRHSRAARVPQPRPVRTPVGRRDDPGQDPETPADHAPDSPAPRPRTGAKDRENLPLSTHPPHAPETLTALLAARGANLKKLTELAA